MKFKKKISLLLIPLITFTLLVGCGKKEVSEDEIVKVRLNEVVRSVFYAPMYVAISEGFFLEEGIEIELSTGQGADKTMQQVLSKSADIGFSGPEQVIYITNQGREDNPVVFAQLTLTDGAFLVGREEDPDFEWSDLKGAEVIGGRPGGMPQMAFEYALKKNGLVKDEDISLVTNIDFTATSGAFIAGTADYVTLFEPTASMLEKEGKGKIVASIGEEVGNLPYTCFYATESYMEENSEIIQKFTNAIYKGQTWVSTHTNEEIAKSIIEFFPGTDENILASVMENYKKINAIATTPYILEEDLIRLMDVIDSYDSNLLTDRPSFEKIVDNSFAEKAVKK